MNGTDAALRLSDGATGDALPALREILEDINNDNQRAGVVFERIINIVRSGSVQIVPTDPVELLGQVEGMVASRVAKAGVRLECSSSGRLPMLAADPVLVLMMILNLIDNAVTALSWDDVKNQSQHADLTDPRMGGEISLCPQDAETVCITISDNGPGLGDYTADQFLELLSSTSATGIGLGLPFVESLAEQQGGALETKENVPQGLAVTLKVPSWNEKVEKSATSLPPFVHITPPTKCSFV